MAGENIADSTSDDTSEIEVRPYSQVDTGTSSGSQRVGLDSSQPTSRRLLTRATTIDDEENARVLPHFPYPLVMKVVSSEPRDVLQSEDFSYVHSVCNSIVLHGFRDNLEFQV